MAKIMVSSAAVSLQIRSATEADAGLVLSFIRKLAEYGDLAAEVTASEEDIRAALRAPHPAAEAVLAFIDSEPVGFVLFNGGFSSFKGKAGLYIEDLFVESARRGAGIGKALLVHVARIGVERGCARVEWAALNWNELAMEFYTDLGAVPMDEWTTFRLTGDALERLTHSKD